MRRNLLITLLLAVTLTVGINIITPQNIGAVSASDWKAGRIIDDAVFTNPNEMSVADIQNFLNNLVPNCDTNGTQPASEYGRPDLTHAQYAALRGWPGPPYVCLKNYYEVPKYEPGDYIPANNFSGSIPSGAVSAAQIIFDAAKLKGINPKAILVKIATESAGPLTSDTWPVQSQYTYAMGSHCPDSGPGGSANCDRNYAGFSMQVSSGVGLLRWYLDNMNQPWWSYKKPYQTNSILWNVAETGCGAGDVYIESKATAALYTYTPYQPNQTALNNMYGVGDGCSAYGNRNFWRLWSDWFGSPNYKPTPCKSQIQETKCIWSLEGKNDSSFLTSDENERDSAVYNLHYSYLGMSFYAFASQQPGSIPVYRLRLATEHYYTVDSSERDVLLQNSQNTYEGVAFHVYPPSNTSNASYPVYLLENSSGHIFTIDASTRDQLRSNGYTYNGVAFNAPSGFANSSDPKENSLNIYRLYNNRKHFYTQSLIERDNLLNNGWKFEGVMLSAPAVGGNPIYRLANSSGNHIFTASDAEKSELLSSGWIFEGIGWYIDSNTPQTYRYYANGNHFYTADLNEALRITNTTDLKYEGVAFGVNQSSAAPIYRLFNTSTHFFTGSVDEALSLNNSSWSFEGVAFYTSNKITNTPIHRLSAGSLHFFTASDTERHQLEKAGWKYEGIAWYASDTATNLPVFRLNVGYQYFYTISTKERDQLVKAGWKYEGIAWHTL